MKTFQELLLSIDKDKILSFIESLEQKLTSKWKRNIEREKELQKFSGSDIERFCFEYSESRPFARLILSEKKDRGLFVSNILPLTKNELTYEEYNNILHDFYIIVLNNFKTIKMALSKPDLELKDRISEESKNKFLLFSQNANKSTGSAHPSDRKRWFNFILSVFSKKETLEPEELEKFLIEDGWSEDTAIDLAIEYEFSLSLLAAYNNGKFDE